MRESEPEAGRPASFGADAQEGGPDQAGYAGTDGGAEDHVCPVYAVQGGLLPREIDDWRPKHADRRNGSIAAPAI